MEMTAKPATGCQFCHQGVSSIPYSPASVPPGIMATSQLPQLTRRTLLRLGMAGLLIGLCSWRRARLKITSYLHHWRTRRISVAIPLTAAWAGGVSATEAMVKVRFPAEVIPHLNLTAGDGAPPLRVEAAEVSRSCGVATYILKSLWPDTDYTYEVCFAASSGSPCTGSFRTLPLGPKSFSFAFSSCAATGSSHAVFTTIRKRRPLFFLHLGDLHYEDIRQDDPSAFHAAYDAVLGSPTQSALYRSTALAYLWDDHDYGADGGDRHSLTRLAARAAYRDYIPHHPLPGEGTDAPIYQAFTAGTMRFILLDCRSERSSVRLGDGPRKTLLGEPQKRWLKEELRAAAGKFRLVMIASSVPWVGQASSHLDDSWAGYATERAELADFIVAVGLEGRVCMLCGDAHMLAADGGANSGYARGGKGGMPVWHGSSLDKSSSPKGGPYSEGVYLPKKREGCFG